MSDAVVMPTAETRRAQLRAVEERLMEILPLFQRYRRVPWGDHFEMCLATTRRLLSNDISQAELTELAIAITAPFEPKDGDLQTWHMRLDPLTQTMQPLEGTERYDELAAELCRDAFALRVIGEA